ncbi:MarR family transcriptional regulator [Aliarcobacter butzleri]|uniref:MarR family transcriptional regulator n=1 Tax=Aliarcobacter butzleri TaxID=28197 RepID=A0AAW7Q954_9BACT|nr:MarR family transcriptional regulator [Aliarcobacter butzleri]MDN5107616.1 MarR family transcriptional regulator [Aliarcobacter butzleri]MDN5122940.1 MarR family transcriptional regulator [Aliarcobacter butzleri]
MKFDMNLSLGFILNKTALMSKTLFSQKIKEFDITPEQWSIIFRTVETEGLTQKELSDSTYKDQANITRTIDRLEKKGFLQRQANKLDRRIINIYPTKKAIDIVDDITLCSTNFNDELTKGFTQDEKNQLINLLDRVYKNLEKG